MVIAYIFLFLAILELVAIIVACRILKKRKAVLWKRLLAILLFLVLEFFTIRTAIFPPYDEIATDGPYEVSSEDYWVEKQVVGAYGNTTDIQIRAWYPVGYEGDDHTAKVVVFSHGSCGTIDNNISLYKEMASHGYVVLAVAHPGQAFSMTKADGGSVRVDGDFLKEMTTVQPNKHPEEAFEVYQKWMNERMDELNLVMDDFKVKCAAGEKEYERIADAAVFIVAGHSLGGSAAYAMSRTRDDIIACIALESPCMYDIKGVSNGKFVFDDSEYIVPTLNVYTDSSYPNLYEWQEYQNNVMLLDSRNSHSIYYLGIGHMDICDLSNSSPLLAAILGGTIADTNAETNLTRLNNDCMEFIESLE